jgi:hypothetical protein
LTEILTKIFSDQSPQELEDLLHEKLQSIAEQIKLAIGVRDLGEDEGLVASDEEGFGKLMEDLDDVFQISSQLPAIPEASREALERLKNIGNENFRYLFGLQD